MKRSICCLSLMALIIVICSSSIKKEPKNKAELGKLLFFDPILSSNKKISCASCHKPMFAFADTTAVSRGVANRKGTRNTPSAMNLSLQRSFFWDGRSGSLALQALDPIQNPDEMNLPVDRALERLSNDPEYAAFFQKIFNAPPNRENLGAALSAFERTLETNDSPFDRWKLKGDTNAVSAAARRGFLLFNGKGKCNKCHFGADLTAQEFRNIGLFNGRDLNDPGRALVTKESADAGKFKTPGLRNIGLTAPYMHNGKFRTLDQVIDFYNDPVKIVPDAIGRDSILMGTLGLTAFEKDDLKQFLLSLTDRSFIDKTKR